MIITYSNLLSPSRKIISKDREILACHRCRDRKISQIRNEIVC